MRIAIPHWRGRVSPVFDVAGALLLVDVDHGKQIFRENISLGTKGIYLERVRHVQELGVEVLICCAISRPLESALISSGIKVISQICGDADQVLGAFIAGQLEQGGYSMPGPCEQRRRFGRNRLDGINVQNHHFQQWMSELAMKQILVANVDQKLCTACGACVDACVCSAIQIENGSARVNEEECIGCGVCVRECPVDAIKIA
jgi:Pyruvate/2-oxoacid:ferredoxin oxidoreductase delta subunit